MAMDPEVKRSDEDREAAFRERMHLEGEFGRWLYEHLWNEWDRLHLGGAEFRCAYDEEYDELGYHRWSEIGKNVETGEPVMVEDQTTLIRRESDGAFFEVDIEVSLSRVEPKNVQLELPVEAAP
jgi:hypothetical protein